MKGTDNHLSVSAILETHEVAESAQSVFLVVFCGMNPSQTFVISFAVSGEAIACFSEKATDEAFSLTFHHSSPCRNP